MTAYPIARGRPEQCSVVGRPRPRPNRPARHQHRRRPLHRHLPHRPARNRRRPHTRRFACTTQTPAPNPASARCPSRWTTTASSGGGATTETSPCSMARRLAAAACGSIAPTTLPSYRPGATKEWTGLRCPLWTASRRAMSTAGPNTYQRTMASRSRPPGEKTMRTSATRMRRQPTAGRSSLGTSSSTNSARAQTCSPTAFVLTRMKETKASPPFAEALAGSAETTIPVGTWRANAGSGCSGERATNTSRHTLSFYSRRTVFSQSTGTSASRRFTRHPHRPRCTVFEKSMRAALRGRHLRRRLPLHRRHRHRRLHRHHRLHRHRPRHRHLRHRRPRRRPRHRRPRRRHPCRRRPRRRPRHRRPRHRPRRRRPRHRRSVAVWD